MTAGERRTGGGKWWRSIPWAGAALLWLAPLVAMQVTAEVNWTGADFAVWAAMLLSAATAFDLLSRRSGELAYHAGLAVAIGTAFLLVWVNLAAGVIGSERNDANLMYAGVLALAAGLAWLGRFRPAGMARATIAAAIAQALVAVVALAGRLGADGPLWPRDLLGATGIFVILWLFAAALFRAAARGAVNRS